jgi:hypothetical protein
MVTEKKLLKADLERQAAVNDKLKAELDAYQTD